MILRHWQGEPVGDPYSVEQSDAPDQKPKGFWLSDERDETSWRRWCESEEFRAGCFEHWADFQVDMNRVLHLETANAVLDFGRKFHAIGYAPWCNWIDWRRVAQDYGGIVITPYQWTLRLEDAVDWYYSWDCASGCIWDASCLVRVADSMSEAA